MRVAIRKSNGRIVAGQEIDRVSGVDVKGSVRREKLTADETDAILRANIAATPIPVDDIDIVDMPAATYERRLRLQLETDMREPKPQPVTKEQLQARLSDLQAQLDAMADAGGER